MLFRSGDGYVSHQDVDNYLRTLKINPTKQELGQLMKLLDTSNKGFLTFNEFSQKFSTNMSSDLVKLELKDNYLPNMQPSEDMYQLN